MLLATNYSLLTLARPIQLMVTFDLALTQLMLKLPAFAPPFKTPNLK